MTIEIPFDPKIAAEQSALRTKLTLKRHITRGMRNLIWAGGIIVFGWVLINFVKGEMISGYLFLTLGLFYFFNFITYVLYYRKTKKAHEAFYLEMIELRAKSHDSTIWSFEDDTFRYKNMHFEHSVKWEAFKGYRVLENTLFLQLIDSLEQSYMIGEREVGHEQFVMMVVFVDKKIKPLGNFIPPLTS